jgi:hypothetical protein
MIAPPNGAPDFPADYLAYLKSMRGDECLPAGVLFCEPRDPGTTLGRQGDENFPCSVLVGRRQDLHLVVLTFDSKRVGHPRVWRYCIVAGAEWDVVVEFQSFAELRDFLRNERKA